MTPQRLWAWPVRLCHWSLAGLLIINFVADSGDYTHRLVGYITVGIVIVRLMWGTVSRSNGRLRALRPSVPETFRYLGHLRRGVVPRFAGHNPLAIWMIWLIWLLVLLLGVTGWMSRLDAFWGDDAIHLAHALLADLLLGCIGLHLAAVVLMSILLKESLPLSMLVRRRARE